MSKMRILTTLAIGGLLLAGCSQQKSKNSENNDSDEPETQSNETAINNLSEEEVAEGWELLFDGETTDKWRGYNKDAFPTQGWHIRDGNLAVEHSGEEEDGFGGDIITIDTFENFELTIEFAVTKEGNSGVLYRVVEKTDEAIWYNAPEYQVLDDQAYIDMGTMDMTTHLTGDNYDLHSSKSRESKPVGEWNSARIIVNGSHVEHWLNGIMTVEYEFESEEWENLVAKSKFSEYPDYGRTKDGHIGLQDHGHLIRFRNIKIRRL